MNNDYVIDFNCYEYVDSKKENNDDDNVDAYGEKNTQDNWKI